MTQAAPTPLRLIGNPSENFYILGKKHYTQFRQLQSRLDPLADSWVGKLQSFTQTLRGKKSERVPQGPWEEWLVSYCEGLEVPVSNYLAFLDELEKGSLPGGILPGHTSVFQWNQDEQRAAHLCLLDRPLVLPADTKTELILFQAPGQQAVLLLCAPALPFFPLAMMNESGVTLAMHPKYHTLDHSDGTPIGQIAFESMLEARSVPELKKLLKRYQTKRLWGLHALDPAGQVLALDVMGPQMDGQSFSLSDEKILVFNSAPLVKDQPQQAAAEPPNFTELCREKRRWCLEKLKTPGDAPALVQLTRATKVSKFIAPAITTSTMTALAFHPDYRRCELLEGFTPQWFQGEMWAWNDLFTTSMRQPEHVKLSRTKDEQHEWDTRKQFSDAQRAMDADDSALAFHHIQMGLAMAQGELKKQASWVWAWWQWKHLSGKRDRLLLLAYVRELLAESPQRPQLKFLLLLLEVELDLAATVAPPELPAAFREWSDTYLQSPAVRRLQMQQIPMARLDIQDCVPLKIPTWTKAIQPG